MLALVVVVWVCLLVAICSDAVEVWLQHKLDRAHRAQWAEVGDDWGTDYETPHEQAQRVGARVYCNCGGCCEWRARKLGRRRLTKRWNVRKLLPRPKLKKNRA